MTRRLPPIPTPLPQRWRRFRRQVVPALVFGLGALAAAWLWARWVAPPTLVAEAETRRTEVRAAAAGTLTRLDVDTLQIVAAGQVIGTLTGNAADLIAPIDGIISAVRRQPGEHVTPGESIVQVSALRSERLVGYLRQPLTVEPRVGRTAQFRSRSRLRAAGTAIIAQVSGQLEPIPPTLLAAMHLPASSAGTELGVRVHLTTPGGFELRPGEQVDVILRD